MNDFKNYTPPTPDDDKSKIPPNINDVNSAVEFAKIVSKSMNGKSEGQLLKTILAEAECGKREGRLTNADLDNFYTALAPMLDGYKRKKLKDVIIKLKNI